MRHTQTLSNSLLNVTERFTIEDLSGSTTGYNSGLSASNLNPQADVILCSPVPYTFNLVSGNAEFIVNIVLIATINDPIKSNDTLSFYQRFYNYFA